METIAKLPFSNLQLEFLKLYESGVSEDDLKAINQLIVNYLANKVQDNADLQWEEKGFSNLLMDEWLSKDLRK
jgi:hypothetical protein